MNIHFDLHTHTSYSHGSGSISDNAAAAQALGIGLGIADHGLKHIWYGLNKKSYLDQRGALLAYNQAHGAHLLQGVEANVLTAKKSDAGVCPVKPHYVLLGFHKGMFPNSLIHESIWLDKKLAPARAKARMTDALIYIMENEDIDVITHPGLYCPVDIPALSAAAARLGVALEVNNQKPMADKDVAAALEAGVFFLASSDAHTPGEVGRVDVALAVLERAGVPPDRVINCQYAFDRGLRIDKLKPWRCLSD